jgi:uncharacterized protein YbjT (DUF2867 family)
LNVFQGDALDAATMSRAVDGHDAVISTIGPSRGTPAAAVISTAVGNILAAMQTSGAKRFVFESGVMAGEGKGLALGARLGVGIFRLLNRALYEDKVRAEKAIRESPVDWVIVRPPTLKEKSPTGKARVGVDLDVKVTTPMAFADVADVLIQAADEDRWVRQAVECSY